MKSTFVSLRTAGPGALPVVIGVAIWALAPLSAWAQADALDTGPATARVEISVQLPAGPAVRSIGLLLAADRGYFSEAGLDVTLLPTTPGQSAVANLADGNADLAVDIMAVALKARADGANIVNIAQFFQRATLGLLCRPEIDQPGKLAGENIGVWLGGWESSFYAWLNRLGLSYFASGSGVTILRQGTDSEMFQAGEVDCMTTATYLTPLLLAGTQVDRATLVDYSYEELGLGVLEDGLYVRAEDLGNAARVDVLARFLGAAQRGWAAAHDDPAAALKVLVKDGGNKTHDEAALSEALTAVNKAVMADEGLVGHLDPAAYDRSINLLLTGAPEPILVAAPDGAASDLVFKRQRELGRQQD